jgi:sugar/nucleoside kinase (ribokinase family)
MTAKYDILAVGSYTVDLVFTGMPALPELGKEVYSSGFDMVPGEAYNSVVAMLRLGVKVAWAADFGNDVFSRYALDQARLEGVDPAYFVRHNRALRRITVSASFPADRAFITYYDPDPALPAAMKALALVSARAVYIPGFYYGPFFDAGLRLIRLKKMKLIMDGNSGDEVVLTDPLMLKSVQNVDVLLPNAAEARRMTGKAGLEEAMADLGDLCPLVAVKDGKNGSYAWSDGRLYHAPAIDVTPLDTTGAGDCFNAGFIKAWLGGRPLVECLRWGNVVGGLSTLARGATGRRITLKEVEEHLAKYRSDESQGNHEY